MRSGGIEMNTMPSLSRLSGFAGLTCADPFWPFAQEVIAPSPSSYSVRDVLDPDEVKKAEERRLAELHGGTAPLVNPRPVMPHAPAPAPRRNPQRVRH